VKARLTYDPAKLELANAAYEKEKLGKGHAVSLDMIAKRFGFPGGYVLNNYRQKLGLPRLASKREVDAQRSAERIVAEFLIPKGSLNGVKDIILNP
jgi:hypothetical protein